MNQGARETQRGGLSITSVDKEGHQPQKRDKKGGEIIIVKKIKRNRKKRERNPQ